MKKLAIITSHPIQYNAPLFKLLSERNELKLKVFYTWGESVLKNKFDPGFGKNINWDIDLLDGYDYELLKNVAQKPGSHHFWGIDNPNLISKVEAFHPSAILVFGWAFKSHLKCLINFKNKIPVYFRGDSTLLDEQVGFRFKKTLRKLFLTWVYKHIDYALYVGTNNKNYYLKHGLREPQLVFAPHAIDNDRFYINSEIFEKEALEWRKKMGIDDHEIVFLFAGKLEQKKNPEILIKAFITIQKEGSHLILVGNGVLEHELKKKYDNFKNIHFNDFQNQTIMPIVYRIGNVFVLPSSGPNETWGLSLNEALACSRPVIASDKCGAAIDLINYKTGWVFKSNDITDLISCMDECFINKNLFDKKRNFAAEFIKNYSYNKIAIAIENTILNTC